MTYLCLHALCVRNKYPADVSTVLYMCDLNTLGGFNFYTKGGRIAPRLPHTGSVLTKVTPYGFCLDQGYSIRVL